MCLGVPGKIISVDEDAPLRMGTVDFGGIEREVCLAHVPEAALGDYVIVHVGFAISRLDEEEAQATLALLREMGELKRELGEDDHDPVKAAPGSGSTAGTPVGQPPAGKQDP